MLNLDNDSGVLLSALREAHMRIALRSANLVSSFALILLGALGISLPLAFLIIFLCS